MSTSQNNDGNSVKPTPSSASMLATIGDTTWRMFVPTIGLTIAGLFLDKWLQTKPWLMIVGIICGAALSYVLVKRQLNKV